MQKDDVILVITTPGEADALRLIFGEQEQTDWNTENIDWNAVDSQLTSQRILVTRPEINGKKLSSLRLRNNYGINISRVYRSGVQLLATPDLRLQMGDRLTVVGEAAAIKHVEKILGNAVKNLEEPNLVAVFVGLILGLTLGSIPVSIPGISLPVKLGLAGGPIIVGILIGTFGPRLHMITYTTYSANLMLRALGLSMYLACLGLEAGTHFFETVMRPEGALWLLLGFLLTFVPVVLLGIFALRILRIDFGSVAGMLCGSMANPMALNYANDTIEGDNPSVSYATVYPLCMFLRVIIIQVMLMVSCNRRFRRCARLPQVAERLDIASRRVLEHPQVELGDDGQHMVEDIRLDAFVIHPHHRIRKEIEFHRQSRLRRLQLAHHQGHPLVDRHLVAQVPLQIGTEYPEVGLVQAVDLAFAGADAMRGVVLLDPLLGLIDIFADDVYVAVSGQHLGRTEFHARHVQVHRTLHAAPARRLHPAPVLERIAHQQVRRQRNDRIVPVLHFHGRERHLDHRTVRTVFGHGDPVPHLEHVVRRELDAGYEAEDTVAEISMMTAAEAPSPVSRMAGDLPIRIETIRMPQISAAIPCPVWRNPLIGLFATLDAPRRC